MGRKGPPVPRGPAAREVPELVPLIGDAGEPTLPASPVATPFPLDTPGEAGARRATDTVVVAGSAATIEPAARGRVVVTGAEEPGRARRVGATPVEKPAMGMAPGAGPPLLARRASGVEKAVTGGEQVVSATSGVRAVPFAVVAPCSKRAARGTPGSAYDRGRS